MTLPVIQRGSFTIELFQLTSRLTACIDLSCRQFGQSRLCSAYADARHTTSSLHVERIRENAVLSTSQEPAIRLSIRTANLTGTHRALKKADQRIIFDTV